MARVETRVARIAEALLAERRTVRPVDLLVGLGWLAQPNVERWARGRVPLLDRCVGVGSDKVMAALAALRHWAEDRGLTPSEADYQDLQFTADGDSDAERAYRTHWASSDTPEFVVERPPRRPQRIIVISPHNAWTCASCGATGDLLRMDKAGPLCLDCADLGHLEFLPSGNTALTRRATKASGLSAVVVRWSTRRNRYERQGILAEAAAIEQAAQECLSDADVRARRREHEQSRRADQDVRFGVSSPPLSASSSRVVPSTAQRRSHFMRRYAAAAVWDEAPPGERWTAMLYASPSLPPSAMSRLLRRPAHVGSRPRIGSSTSAPACRGVVNAGATVSRCSTDSHNRASPFMARPTSPTSKRPLAR